MESLHYEPNPAFNLTKYGKIVVLNFNQQFAKKFRNILNDSSIKLDESATGLLQSLNFHLGTVEAPAKSERFVLDRFQYVFNMTCERDFGRELHKVLYNFLTDNRISPAMFSFVKQFEACLYPQQTSNSYADDAQE